MKNPNKRLTGIVTQQILHHSHVLAFTLSQIAAAHTHSEWFVSSAVLIISMTTNAGKGIMLALL